MKIDNDKILGRTENEVVRFFHKARREVHSTDEAIELAALMVQHHKTTALAVVAQTILEAADEVLAATENNNE